MSKSIIIDLDGCIADDRWRQHLIDRSKPETDWSEYHQACEGDKAINIGILMLCSALGAEPIFITGRPEYVRKTTARWIQESLDITPFVLLMRAEGDTSTSPELKRKLLKYVSVPDVLCAFDDRRDVIDMYKKHDIPTVIVSYDERFDAQYGATNIPDLLRSGAKTFEERNAVYGETYLAFGKAMAAMFPEGLKIDAGDIDTFNLLGIFVQIMTKTCRYATSLPKGGHVDSAHDAMVYSAMLEHLTRKATKQ